MQLEKRDWEKIADIFLIVIVYFSLVACLIKTDYNFIIGLFGYIFWQNRYNMIYLSGSMDIRRILLIMLLITIVYDLSWQLMIKKEWTIQDGTAQTVLWNKLGNLHSINIFCTFTVIILKIGTSYSLINARQDLEDINETTALIMREQDFS